MKKNTSNKHHQMKQKLANNTLDEKELKGMLTAWTLLSPYCRHISGSICVRTDKKPKNAFPRIEHCVFKECPPFLISKNRQIKKRKPE